MPVMHSLQTEFRGTGVGRQKGMSVLFEYILIFLVRMAVEQKAISKGVLFSMLDAQLGRALNAIHLTPEMPWSVNQLADLASMSRSKFSALLTELVPVLPHPTFSPPAIQSQFHPVCGSPLRRLAYAIFIATINGLSGAQCIRSIQSYSHTAQSSQQGAALTKNET
jgi:hypothetical protein